MLKVILILVYLYGGSTAGPELIVERTVFSTPEACAVAGETRATKLIEDPKFIAGLFAACVPALVQEAKVE